MQNDTDFSDLEPRRGQRPQKVIDMKLPLPWLLVTGAGIIGSFALLYNNVERLVRDVQELQSTVKAGNNQSLEVIGKLELLKYRVETLEADRRKQTNDTPRNGR